MPNVEGWRYPAWQDDDDGSSFLKQGAETVGWVSVRDDGSIKWHCLTSDWRNTDAKTVEQAKAECEASFWQEAWHRATGHRRG